MKWVKDKYNGFHIFAKTDGVKYWDGIAMIERMPNGSHSWNIFDSDFRGNEPTFEHAKIAVKYFMRLKTHPISKSTAGK